MHKSSVYLENWQISVVWKSRELHSCDSKLVWVLLPSKYISYSRFSKILWLKLFHKISNTIGSYRIFCILSTVNKKLRGAKSFQIFFCRIVFTSTFWNISQNSHMVTLPQNIKYRKLFQNQKRLILENIHPCWFLLSLPLCNDDPYTL